MTRRTGIWLAIAVLLVGLGIACGDARPECTPGKSFKVSRGVSYHCEDNGTGAHWVKD